MPRISPQTIEQVAAANDIVEVIGSYVPLKKAGATFKALCPFHREKSPSFTVNPQRQSFKCFGCGAGGSVFRFLMNYENLDFPAAVRRLAERANVPIVEEAGGPGDEHEAGAGRLRRRLLGLHAEAAEWFHKNLTKKEFAAHARAYLQRREFGSETANTWQLGYAPEGWDVFLTWARGRGYSVEELIHSGLVKARDEEAAAAALASDVASRIAGLRIYDRFRDRLMFPICNELGEVIAFSGRVLRADAEGVAKYVNSPETPLFTKGKVLFGLDKSRRAILEAKTAIVCEGQLDLIRAFEAGVKNVTAPQGTAFTERQARLLKRYADEVILCFDADAAGQQAAERSFAALLEAGLSVRVATMPAGEDPDSLIRRGGAEAFRARVGAAQDFFDFQIERLGRAFDMTTPRGQAQFSRRMAESVALVGEPALREA
ncbi:MAG: DNA primase, partial [Verrucomicrobia bacterium]|nr:DNA primase [Verrucomicrobiota bacterium]